MAARLLLGPLIGGLSHDRVNLWGRADSASTLYAWLATKKDPSYARLAGKVKLTAATAFAGIVSIKRLKADTTYYFALTLSQKKPPKREFRKFSTFPEPGQIRPFRFAFGSCFRRAGNEPGATFRHILEHQKDLCFLLMLGDQTYADEWKYNGLGKVAVTRDEYRQAYLNTWSQPDLRRLLASVPVFMTLDDHEVDNDWHWQDSPWTPRSSSVALNSTYNLAASRATVFPCAGVQASGLSCADTSAPPPTIIVRSATATS